jgi:putative ABC transport system ATP-binding protein/macrolide transport system ATP-binding/permease protein
MTETVIPLIRLLDIDKTYVLGDIQVPVLRKISLSIEAGELVALTGSSGSGKSTLMNILGCLDRPTAGIYCLEGKEIGSLSSDERAELRNRKIGFVFQNFHLLPRTSALDNVLMPLTYSSAKLSDRQARESAAAMLHRVGLGDRMHHEPSQLSGGQQQRVAIARALINRPSVLLADEPTGNLDSKTSSDILHMFRTLNKVEGITIIIVTHDPAVAAHAGREIHISDGSVVSGASEVLPTKSKTRGLQEKAL